MVFTMVVGLVFLTQQLPALACSCEEPPPLAEQIELAVSDADAQAGRLFFVGEQITDEDQPHTFRVDVVLGGQVDGATIDASVPIFETSCGSSTGTLYGRGRAAYEVVPGPGGPSIVLSSCWGSPFSPTDALAVTGQALPPTGEGPPSFVVGHRSAASNLAVLDRHGEIIAINDERSDGRVLELAPCPQAAAIAVAVSPRDRDTPARIEVWSLPDLALLATIETQATLRFGHGWQTRAIDGLECHDPAGDVVSWLEPGWDGMAGPPVRVGGTMVVARDGIVDRFDVGPTRALTVDHAANRAWTIAGENGDQLRALDLAGRTVQTEVLPNGVTGRSIQRNDDGSLLILADSSFDPLNDHLARFDTVVSGPPGALVAAPTTVVGWLRATANNRDDVIALVRVPRTGTYATSISADGTALAIRLTGHEHEKMAVGRCGLLDGGLSGPPDLDFVSHSLREVQPVVGFGSARVSVSLEPVDAVVFERLAQPVERRTSRSSSSTTSDVNDRALSGTAVDVRDEPESPLSPLLAIPGCDSVTATFTGADSSWVTAASLGAGGAAVGAVGLLALWRRRSSRASGGSGR